MTQEVDPTWENVHLHASGEEGSGQQWVRLSPMTGGQVDHMTRANNHKTKQYNESKQTIMPSDHFTSGDENKLDYPSRSTVTDVDENRQGKVEYTFPKLQSLSFICKLIELSDVT